MTLPPDPIPRNTPVVSPKGTRARIVPQRKTDPPKYRLRFAYVTGNGTYNRQELIDCGLVLDTDAADA